MNEHEEFEQAVHEVVELPPLLGYQSAALDKMDEIRAAREGSVGQSIIGVAPPGAGKSRIMIEMCNREIARGGRPLVKVHRKMLLEQMYSAFSQAGVRCGVISPDYVADYDAPVMLCSTQTLFSRSIRSSKIEFPDATLVLNDEAHQQTSMTERALAFGASNEGFLQAGYLSRGVDLVGFTATPLMEQRVYSKMVQIAQYSTLRDAGMHQIVKVFGPSEIDVAGLKQNAKTGDYSEKQLEGRVTHIFGDVYDNWMLLNPDALPTVLFAPSLETSKWFCYELNRKGVLAAHIGSDGILMPNNACRVEVWPSTRETRKELMRRSRCGEVQIVCNRFILREAIDMPWLYHAIFATVMGSPTTALQSVGRLQRAYHAYDCKILQDHGGFYWRHGSPNSDRHWRLGMTNKVYQAERIKRLQRGEEKEGICCPKCGFWRYAGPVCLNEKCRHAHSQSVRRVQQVSGKLKQTDGQVYVQANDLERCKKIWRRKLFACGSNGQTVGSAVAQANSEASSLGLRIEWSEMPYSPPRANSVDWHRKVSDVYPWMVKALASKGVKKKDSVKHGGEVRD